MKNQTFKKLLLISLIFLISSIFAYACYSFVYADFNFANWSSDSRGKMIYLSLLLTFLVGMFISFQQFIND
jgi:hypothetical protein